MYVAPVAEDATYPYDLSTGTEKPAPTTASKSNSRKQTLMSLIEALLHNEGLLAERELFCYSRTKSRYGVMSSEL